MAAVFMPAGDHALEINICRNCQRLWLDSAERSTRTLPLYEDSVPERAPRPINGGAQERLVGHLVKRKIMSPSIYEIVGRIFVGAIIA